MKKNKKIISLSLAALLTVGAVAPITSVKPVKAETVAQGTEVKEKPYFTYKGQKLADGATIPGPGLSFKNGQNIGSIETDATDAVELHVNGQTYKEFEYGADNESIIKELRKQNITVNGTAQMAQISGEISGFTLTLSTSGFYTYKGKPTTVVIPFGTGKSISSADAPQVEFQQDGKDTKLPINGQFFQVAQGAKFNPLDFTASDGTEYKITAPDYNLNVADNPVDTSKAGSSSTVKLNATNKKTGKKMTVSYTVLVSPKGKQQLVNGWDPTYSIDSKTGLPHWISTSNLSNKTKISVTKDTKIIDGTSYTKVIANNVDHLMKTIDVIATQPATPEKVVTKTVMHKSIVYNNKAKPTSQRISAYKKVKVEKDTQQIGYGQEYYKLADGSGFIKNGNIDGSKISLKHNAYVYRNNGRRANSKVLKRRSTVTIYGGSFKFKNGKRYYRIGKNQYIKVANIRFGGDPA